MLSPKKPQLPPHLRSVTRVLISPLGELAKTPTSLGMRLLVRRQGSVGLHFPFRNVMCVPGTVGSVPIPLSALLQMNASLDLLVLRGH